MVDGDDGGRGCLLSAFVALLGSALAMVGGYFLMLYLLGKKWSELGQGLSGPGVFT